jgi:dienelactone hydrolase
MRPLPLLAAILLHPVLAHAQLPNTQPLTTRGDLAAQMVEGIDRFLTAQTELSLQSRAKLWHRDFSSKDAYEKSVASHRASLAKVLGVVDPRDPFDAPELIATPDRPALVARTAEVEIFVVRWPVLGPIHGEGLLLIPTSPIRADVVALPDADQTPEQLTGLAPGVPAESRFPLRLALSGCRVLVPTLVDRSDSISSLLPSGQKTNQPDREYVYRPAFEVGRHVIGYEIQKVLAAVDYFSKDARQSNRPIGVIGYGEGALLAFDSAALDTRIDSACVSGYFTSRQSLWSEPIYRNVFGLLREFGDAEIATLVAPRPLIIEPCRSPEIPGPPPPRDGRSGAAPGKLTTPSLASVRDEVQRAKDLVAPHPSLDRIALIPSGDDAQGPFASTPALAQFLSSLNIPDQPPPASELQNLRPTFDPAPRLRRQVEQMQDYTQHLVGESEYRRADYWKTADRSSPEKYQESLASYREQFATELIGRFDEQLLPPNPRTRQILDTPAFTGYEVMLDVYPDVFAEGILLVPKSLKPGERRPVVVCQHGLEGTPASVVSDARADPTYHRFAATLAEEGFITYAPQNPYTGRDRFRVLQRKANPLKKTLFSVIVPQHRQTVDWLATLPFVDPDRIAFYGLSYGGKTAMRVPALVPRYCLSICSGDFNEWVWKCTTLRWNHGYVGMNEYEMFEWNLANTFNYAEMAALIAPRPFMVERGHRDGVGLDSYVAYEYAKVRLLYADLHLPNDTAMEFFDGPHTIHGVGTFQFLHDKLHFPKPQ